MKQSALIQTILVILGILSIYYGLQSLIAIIMPLLEWKYSPGYEFSAFLSISVLLVIFSHFFIGFYLIRKSGAWSAWLVRKSQLEDGFKIISSPKTILYFLFLILGFYSLSKELPFLVDKLFASFRNNIHGGATDLIRRYDDRKPWSQIMLNNLIPLLIILFARDLAANFSKKLEPDQPVVIEESAIEPPGTEQSNQVL